jgi:GNAT superfamily N-acetyltransferase
MIQLHNIQAFKEKLNIKEVLPKKEYPIEAKMNQNIYKTVWDDNTNTWCFLTISNEKYAKFVSKFVDDSIDEKIQVAYACLPYEQIVYIPEDTVNNDLLKMNFFGDVLSIKSDKFSIILNPFMNGVMIYGLNVNEKYRNTGIGTKIINQLYDLSEELDVALYLTPYPDDNSEKSEIWNKVNRLRNWYKSLGFGPIFNNELVYSNYEDDCVLKLINNKIK